MEMLGEAGQAKWIRCHFQMAQWLDIPDLVHMEDQLIGQIKLAKYFSLPLDECTDVAISAILMVYVCFECEGDLKEEGVFFCFATNKN